MKRSVNLITTYEEVNLGDDLLLQAALESFEKDDIKINGFKLPEVFKARKSKISRPHILRLRFFSRNIYYGGTNFLPGNDSDIWSLLWRKVYYSVIALLFRIELIGNGISENALTYKLFYNLCRCISVRDLESSEILKKNKITCSLHPDPVVEMFRRGSLVFSDKTRYPNVLDVIIVRARYYELPVFKDEINNLLNGKSGCEVSHIIFFQEGESRNLNLKIDSAKCKIVEYDGSWGSLQEILKIIRSARCIYSMRLHGLLLGRLYNLKTVPINVDDKLLRTYVGF
jgi:polysaccharide pyruvyl transferase WcaK-like protein